MKLKKFKKVLPVIGILIFIYLIYRVGPSNIISDFKKIKFGYLLISIILSFLVVMSLGYKWGTILKKQNIRLGFWHLQKIYLIGIFYGFITPARTGSLIRAMYIKEKTKQSIIESSTSIFLERILDLSVIFLLAVIGASLLTEFIPGISSKIALAFIVFIVLALVFIERKRSHFVLRVVYKLLVPAKFKSLAKSSFRSFYNSLPPLKNLIYPLILTLIVWVLNYTQEYTVAKAFSINIPYHYFITIVPIATVISLIPITISGLGTREAALITLFSVFGISAQRILAMSIVSIVLFGGIPAFIGFILSLKK